ALRVVGSWIAFGSPFFVRDPGYGFSPSGMAGALPFCVLATLVMVPAGLVAALAYSGRRALELRITVVLVILFFSAYGYGGEPGGIAGRLILGPRYLAPLVPLLALALADGAARLAARPLALAAKVWAAVVVAFAFSIHPALAS